MKKIIITARDPSTGFDLIKIINLLLEENNFSIFLIAEEPAHHIITRNINLTNYDKHITKDSIIKAVGNDVETDATSVDQKTTSSSNILLQRTESLLNNAAEHDSSEPESLLYEMLICMMNTEYI